MRGEQMKKLNANLTIEAAVIVPLILMIAAVVISILFYYHDKNVLLGTAHETAAYGAGLRKTDEDALENYFSSRIKGKLLLFSSLENEIKVEEEKVTFICHAKKGELSLQVACSVQRTEPEDYIRSIRKMKKIGEELGDQN